MSFPDLVALTWAVVLAPSPGLADVFANTLGSILGLLLGLALIAAAVSCGAPQTLL